MVIFTNYFMKDLYLESSNFERLVSLSGFFDQKLFISFDQNKLMTKGNRNQIKQLINLIEKLPLNYRPNYIVKNLDIKSDDAGWTIIQPQEMAEKILEIVERLQFDIPLEKDDTEEHVTDAFTYWDESAQENPAFKMKWYFVRLNDYQQYYVNISEHIINDVKQKIHFYNELSDKNVIIMEVQGNYRNSTLSQSDNTQEIPIAKLMQLIDPERAYIDAQNDLQNMKNSGNPRNYERKMGRLGNAIRAYKKFKRRQELEKFHKSINS